MKADWPTAFADVRLSWVNFTSHHEVRKAPTASIDPDRSRARPRKTYPEGVGKNVQIEIECIAKNPAGCCMYSLFYR